VIGSARVAPFRAERLVESILVRLATLSVLEAGPVKLIEPLRKLVGLFH
jgi:hypothetical protein